MSNRISNNIIHHYIRTWENNSTLNYKQERVTSKIDSIAQHLKYFGSNDNMTVFTDEELVQISDVLIKGVERCKLGIIGKDKVTQHERNKNIDNVLKEE